MKEHDLVFVKFSNMLPPSTPLIILEKYPEYRNPQSIIFVVLDPHTGHRYHYQEHNLSEVPCE